jgi:hypothetical protein
MDLGTLKLEGFGEGLETEGGRTSLRAEQPRGDDDVGPNPAADTAGHASWSNRDWTTREAAFPSP